MADNETNASELIDERIEELGDWRGKRLGKVRGIINEADPDVVEEWRWAKSTSPGTPVWSHDGGICTGETYKTVVKLTFFKGAALKDPSGLFNSSLEGKVRRAIDIEENDEINEAALKNLIREAVALNLKSYMALERDLGCPHRERSLRQHRRRLRADSPSRPEDRGRDSDGARRRRFGGEHRSRVGLIRADRSAGSPG